MIAFDQRGCLSPRLCLFAGDADAARRFVELLIKRLARLEHDVPRGALSRDELADQTRYRDSMLYAAELFPAGKGAVGLDVTGDALVLPPIGRNLHVQVVRDPAVALAQLGGAVAALGLSVSDAMAARLTDVLPRARRSALGRMQRPPFDGPVDLRGDFTGEVL